jgi:hypothetical protein
MMQALRTTCKRLGEYPYILLHAPGTSGECANSDDCVTFGHVCGIVLWITSDAVGFSLES